MKSMYVFIENKDLYNFVMSTMYLSEAKNEKEILDLWRKGYNNCDIAKQIGYTEGTIRNRKKEIAQKYNKLLDDYKINFF